MSFSSAIAAGFKVGLRLTEYYRVCKADSACMILLRDFGACTYAAIEIFKMFPLLSLSPHLSLFNSEAKKIL